MSADSSLYAVTRFEDSAAAAVPDEVLRGVFGAPWRQITRLRLASGDSLGPRTLADSEVMLFASHGRGRALLADGTEVALSDEVGVTLLKGERLHVEADEPGELELYVIEIGTPAH